MKIYIDLDGPILDVKKRTWEVHSKVARSLGGKPFGDQGRYWKQKQENFKRTLILQECGLDERLEKKYLAKYISLIESRKYLKLDKLQKRAKDALKNLSSKYALVLITVRKNSETANEQIKNLNLHRYFYNLLVGGKKSKKTGDVIKANMILQERKKSGYLGTFIVGDSADDILAARILNIKSIAIIGGIRSKNYLKRLKPDFMANSLWDAQKLFST